jgi:hypothetical protein
LQGFRDHPLDPPLAAHESCDRVRRFLQRPLALFAAGDAVAALYASLRDVAEVHLPDVDAAHIAYLGLDDATDVQELDQADCSLERRPGMWSCLTCARSRSTPPGTSPERS